MAPSGWGVRACANATVPAQKKSEKGAEFKAFLVSIYSHHVSQIFFFSFLVINHRITMVTAKSVTTSDGRREKVFELAQ